MNKFYFISLIFGIFLITAMSVPVLGADSAPPNLAFFDAIPTSGQAPLTVSFIATSDSPQTTTTYDWNFGDGTTQKLRSPTTHTYNEPGIYIATLTVDAPDGPIFTSVRITVLPTAEFTANPRIGPVSSEIPLEVQFTDLSVGAVEWEWDFGAGEISSDQNPLHEYKDPGIYTVSLTVWDKDGQEDKTVKLDYIIAGLPSAKFVGSPRTGTGTELAPLEVKFTDLSIGAVRWEWDFGDKTPLSDEQHPTHEYKKPGEFTVTLRVWDKDNQMDELSIPDYVIVVEPGSPLAGFIGVPREGYAPLSVQFTDLSIGDIEKWLWSFGDNEISETQHPKHEYKDPGIYPVILQVWDKNGRRAMYLEPDFIVVKKPNADFVGIPQTGPAPLTVQFLDRSEGVFETRDWEFENGICSPEHPDFDHADPEGCLTSLDPLVLFENPGTFDVTLTATTSDGRPYIESKSRYINATVNRSDLVADFEVLDPLVYPGAEVWFRDTTLGNPTYWEWTFDARRPTPAVRGSFEIFDPLRPNELMHIYATPGTYTVKMTVRDAVGNVDSAQKTVHVVDPRLDAVFTVGECQFDLSPNQNDCRAPKPYCVRFDGSASIVDQAVSSSTSWKWDFSNGDPRSPPRGQVVQSCFAAGDHVVILRVANDFPMSDTEYQIVTVPLLGIVSTEIVPWPSTGNGYSWSTQNDLRITSPGVYTFADDDFPDLAIHVESSGVTLDGKGVVIRRIDGQPDLNLQNILLYSDRLAFSGSAITACNDIVDSSIFVKSLNSIHGIGSLYGEINSTTSITVESIDSSANGIANLYGTISGGIFTVTGAGTGHTHGVESMHSGIISGGEFTVTGKGGADTAGIESIYDGDVSGGKFTVTGSGDLTQGIEWVNGGTVSGGTFIVSGLNAYVFNSISNPGIISGGEFWARGDASAYGIAWLDSSTVEEAIIGGTMNIWGPNRWTTVAIIDNPLTGTDATYSFLSPFDGKQYTRDTTLYQIHDATLREIYEKSNAPRIAIARMETPSKKQRGE